MKRQTFTNMIMRLLITPFIALTINLSAQTTLLTEDFENSGIIPTGWNEYVEIGNPQLNYVTSSSNPTVNNASPGNYFVSFDSYTCNAGDKIWLFHTNPFSSETYYDLTIYFDMYHDLDYSTDNDKIEVMYSTDGISFISVDSYNRYNGTTGWSTEYCSLPAGAENQSNLYIAFRFTSDYGNNVYMDNVVVQGVRKCQIFADNFESYTTGALSTNNDGSEQWILKPIVGDNTNKWVIGTAAGAINGNNGLTINNGADASYTNTTITKAITYYAKKIDARNHTNLSMSMNWKSDGETSADFGEIVYSTNGIDMYELPDKYVNQPTSTSIEVDLSSCDRKEFYIGFRWTNDANGSGNNPPFTIDDITIDGVPSINYNFSESTVSYNHILGTIINLTNGVANLALPFEFNYLGQTYNNIEVSENGWAHLNNSTPYNNSFASNDLASTTAKNLIAALWDDLTMDSQSAIIYKTENQSPVRTFIIEWRDVLWDSQRQNVQVRLYETSHVIEIIYGTMFEPASGSASIGINGLCETRFYSITPNNVSTYSTSIVNNNISSRDFLTEGKMYTFAPYALQTYNTWQEANILVGQTDWSSNSTDISTTENGKIRTPGASCSAISSKNVFAVGARDYHRVQIWNSIPTQNSEPADIILGQAAWTTSNSGTSPIAFNGPSAIAFSPDGQKMLIADRYNNRVLIWNSIPISDTEPADVVIGQSILTTGQANQGGAAAANTLNQPTGLLVLADGRLIITDHENHRVLVFNKIPESNNASANVVIGQTDFSGSTFNTSPDRLNKPWDAGVTSDGKLLISDELNNRILIFNSIPTENGDSADFVIGQNDLTSNSSGTSASKFNSPAVTVSTEGKLAIGDFANHRVLIYNNVPTKNGASADQVLGQDSFTEDFEFSDGTQTTTTPSSRNMSNPYTINFDLNGRLLVNGRDMNRVMLFGEKPGTSADLGINISSNAGATVCKGTEITFTITIRNNGPDLAQNIVVTTSIPAKFDYQTSEVEVGRYNPNSGYWTIPALSNGSSASLILYGNANTDNISGETLSAYASITSVLQADTDFSNNAGSVQIDISSNNVPVLSASNLTDVSINVNSTTNARAFSVSDPDGDAFTITYNSSNTALIPENASNLVETGTAPNYTLEVIPTADKYGYADISMTITDIAGCSTYHDFNIGVGNLWEGKDATNKTDWHTANNWSSGSVPNSSSVVIIPNNPIGGGNYPQINANAETKDLIIESTAKLTLNSGYLLTINGDMQIQSTYQGTGTLVDLNTNGNITILGTPTIQRYLSPDRWHYISSPLTNVSVRTFTENVCSPSFNPNIAYFNEAYSGDINGDSQITYDDGWVLPCYDNGHPVNTDFDYEPARGYAVYTEGYCENAIILTNETATLNSGNINLEITHTNQGIAAADQGWNLVANPYPSGIDATQFITANLSEIDDALYFWGKAGTINNISDDYAVFSSSGSVSGGATGVTPDNYISTAQAFFVRKSDIGTGNVQFTNAMRSTENSYFYKSENMKRFWLGVYNPDNMYNEILIVFRPDADDQAKDKFDILKLKANTNFALYMPDNNNNLIINAFKYREFISENVSIPITLETKISGQFYFDTGLIENFENIGIYLEDRLNKKIIDIHKNDKYNFYAESGTISDRFVVHFGQFPDYTTPTDIPDTQNFRIYSNGNRIFIEHKDNKNQNIRILIYNIAGQLVHQSNSSDSKTEIRLNVAAGIYNVIINAENYSQNQKLPITF